MSRLIDTIRLSLFIVAIIIIGLVDDIVSFFKYLIGKIKR